MKKLTLTLVASLVLLTGCFTPPTQNEYESIVAGLGYGDPLPSEWQSIVKDFMDLRLKDAPSALYKFDEEPFESWTGNASGTGTRVAAGYIVQVLINAKNSYGGYTGYDVYKFIFRDGEVIAYRAPGRYWEMIKPHIVPPKS